MILLKHYRLPFIFSISFHLIIFLLLFSVINFHKINPGYPKDHAIHVHLVSLKDKNTINEGNQNKNILNIHHIKKVKLNIHKLSRNKKPLLNNKKTFPQSKLAIKGTQKENDGVSNLLIQLTATIQKKQRYPDDAYYQQESGIAYIQFKILTDGRIVHVKLIQSSGFYDLDNAAIVAVKAISPFLPAKKYIHSPKEFMIPISFQLNLESDS